MNTGELDVENVKYVTTPMRVTLSAYLPPQARQWSRKRRRKWRRRFVRRIARVQKEMIREMMNRMVKYQSELILQPLTPDANRVVPVLYKREKR